MKRIAAVSGVIVLVILLAIAPLAWHYFMDYNFRTVEEGVLYGARQMDGDALKAYIREYGIRTVVNMRSENKGTPWYDEEVAACREAGVNHVNFAWSKSRIPDPESLARFLDLMESGEKPFLAHCQGGTHRTGTAAAAYLLLRGESPETAREQFTLGFNDAPIGDLVALYEPYDMPFRKWADEVYPMLYKDWKAERERQKAAASEE
jgi:protein tyrosine phosphatase (PTP) superfamily phosphohydrolase (DUF442 family)